MSMTFTKLFSSITESTVWCEPDRTRLVWITMLAMADRYGRVWGSIPGLANRARVPVEDARLAITTFLSPDPDSRSPEQEGRRITEIDGGWQLINHQKYRVLRDEEERRRQNREAKARQRKKVSQSQPKVSQSQPTGQPIADAETDADADALKKNKTTPLPPKGDDSFDQFWKAYPKKVAKMAALRAWRRLHYPNLVATIMATLERFKSSPDWLKDHGKFIPHAATWLNGRRWEDDLPSSEDDFFPFPTDDGGE